MRATKLAMVLFMILAATSCAAPGSREGSPNPTGLGDDETAQIYATAIVEICTVDHSFGESPRWPLVYLLSNTDDLAMTGGPIAPSQTMTAELQEAITAELASQPFELKWIADMNEAPIDPNNGQVAQGEGIVITLGNVHPQTDGSVQLSFFMTCGGLCGIGKTYVLNQVSGSWKVTGAVGPVIMS